jgi:hypothetical protein
MFRIVLETDSLRAAVHATMDGAAAETVTAVTTTARDLRDRLRAQVLAAGLGERLARTWRTSASPTGPPSGSDPVVVRVFSKAPVIIGAFDQGVTIRSRNGTWLAIPTDRVPQRPGRGAGRRLTPVEVEARFNRDLRFVPPRPGRHALLVIDDLTPARSGRGLRPATSRRLAQGRAAGAVVMFVLVPQVTLSRRLDVAAALAAVAAEYPDLTISSLS